MAWNPFFKKGKLGVFYYLSSSQRTKVSSDKNFANSWPDDYMKYDVATLNVHHAGM